MVLEPLSRRALRLRESWSYGYSFSPELLQEWEWSEHFAPQPETLRYLSFVADKFALRADIAFDSRVRAARFDETSDRWTVELEDGRQASARFLITAIGAFSAPTLPNIPGDGGLRGPRLPHRRAGRTSRSTSPASASR